MAPKKIEICGKPYTLDEVYELARAGRLKIVAKRPTPAPKPQPKVTARALKEAREAGVQRAKPKKEKEV